MQLGIHEAFHLNVQMPHWLGYSADWPQWDVQPDRGSVVACYGKSAETERSALVDLVTSLLDGETTLACAAGEGSLAAREARYEALARLEVSAGGGDTTTCRQAEAIMELEEGVADDASWGWLFRNGLTTREELVGRYQAQQDELFYLTGAMQMHVLRLLRADGPHEIAKEIAGSSDPRSGSLTSTLSAALGRYCRGGR